MSVLRAGILEGVGVAVAGGGLPGLQAELERLGAQVCALPDDEPSQDAGLRPEPPAELTALVFDAAAAFDAGGESGLMAVLERAWRAVQAVSARLIDSQRPAKILLIAPRLDAGPHSGAARAALENLARTLSVEWARHSVTTCAVLPGEATTTAQIGELVAFLLSPAGEYFSGGALELGAILM